LAMYGLLHFPRLGKESALFSVRGNRGRVGCTVH
jgi:hypothetical protein